MTNVARLTDYTKVGDIVMYQIQNDVNFRNENGKTLLHIGANIPANELAYYLISYGADVNIKDREGRTPLHEAVQDYCHGFGNMQKIVHLLYHGAIYDGKDINGKTILDYVCESQNSDDLIFSLLNLIDMLFKDFTKNSEGIKNIKLYYYEIRAICGARNSDGNTLLHLSAKHGEVQMVTKFIELGCPFNSRNNENCTPKDLAQNNNHKNVVEFIKSIENAFTGKNFHIEPIIAEKFIEARDEDGKMVLHWAATNGNVGITELLIKKGANIYQKDWCGWTPLHYAAKHDKLEIIIHQLFTWERQLIYSHNTIENCPTKLQLIRNCRDKQGNTILHKAAEYPINYCRLKFLIKNRINVNAVNKKGQTVLDVAIEKMKWDLVKFLLKNNVNVSKLAPDIKQKLIEKAADWERHDIVDIFHSLEKV